MAGIPWLCGLGGCCALDLDAVWASLAAATVVVLRLFTEIVVACAAAHVATCAPWMEVEGSFMVVLQLFVELIIARADAEFVVACAVPHVTTRAA